MVQADDFEQIVMDVVNSGGDTDTNGAVAGAVMGARCGASSTPARWLDNTPKRTHLTELAERLYQASVRVG